MKKHQLEHILRAAGAITGDNQFIVIGSQSIHGKYPDVPDEILVSIEVDLIAKNEQDKTEWLNVIGVDSPFHDQFGYYADPVDEKTAVLPKGWKGRLINFTGDATGGVTELCLDPRDLAISKYVARREKDIQFNRELVKRGLLTQETLLMLVKNTTLSKEQRKMIETYIEADFAVHAREGT